MRGWGGRARAEERASPRRNDNLKDARRARQVVSRGAPADFYFPAHFVLRWVFFLSLVVCMLLTSNLPYREKKKFRYSVPCHCCVLTFPMFSLLSM